MLFQAERVANPIPDDTDLEAMVVHGIIPAHIPDDKLRKIQERAYAASRAERMEYPYPDGELLKSALGIEHIRAMLKYGNQDRPRHWTIWNT